MLDVELVRQKIVGQILQQFRVRRRVRFAQVIDFVNDASAKEVAYVLDKYNYLAVPVVDEDKVVQGIITIDDVLSLVISATWGEKTGLL